MKADIEKRLQRLEEKRPGPKLIVFDYEDNPGVFQVGDKQYNSLEAVRLAFPGRELVWLHVEWDSKPTPPGAVVIDWPEAQ